MCQEAFARSTQSIVDNGRIGNGQRNQGATNCGISLGSEASLCDGLDQPRGRFGDWIPVSRIAIARAGGCGCWRVVSRHGWDGWNEGPDAHARSDEKDGRYEGGAASRKTKERSG